MGLGNMLSLHCSVGHGPLKIPSLLCEVLICDGQSRGICGKRSCTSYLMSSTAGFKCK